MLDLLQQSHVSKKVRGRPLPNEGKTDKVLRSFNTWAFKREQPTEPDLLRRRVAMHLLRDRPIIFVLYWGKGPRADAAEPDFRCLDYLQSMQQRISAVYEQGAHFALCQTDTHARLNGHSDQSIKSYFNDISNAAHTRDMSTVMLSDLVTTMGPVDVDKLAVQDEMLEKLEKCAEKWYRGDGDPGKGARKYLSMNLVERLAVETAFPESIFVTFNGSTYRDIFPPSLPVFYMYSMRRGTSLKPWFLNSDGRAYDGAEDIAG